MTKDPDKPPTVDDPQGTTAPQTDDEGWSEASDQKPEPEPPPPRSESLRAAVGVKNKPSRAARAKARADKKADKKADKRASAATTDDDDDESKPRLSQRAKLIAVLIAIGSVALAALIVQGIFNSKHYDFVCHSKQITAERGRRFPPWGSSTLSGDAWKPIVIPPNTECANASFDDAHKLERVYADALYDQADRRLLSRDPKQIDEASKQLTQALLLTRDPSQEGKRKAIARLQGDVDYARAKAQANAAAKTLEQAAKQFDEAAQKVPRHSRDSAAWAAYARQLSSELLRGPVALRKDAPPEAPATDAAPGTSSTPDRSLTDAGVPAVRAVDAEPGVALPPDTDGSPPLPDAGLPTGGVLL